MYKALAIAILCVSFLAGAAYSTQFPGRYPSTNPNTKQDYTLTFSEANTAGIYSVDRALSYTAVDFLLGSDFSGQLYNCTFRGEEADTDSSGSLANDANCVLISSLTATTTASVSTKKPWLNLEIDVAETAGNASYLTIKGSFDQVADSGGGGLAVDNDKDGRYEFAYLWDADGDGSGKVQCTAANTPDPACRGANEVIYRDFSDDFNCALHGGGNCASSTRIMEEDGVLALEEGVVYLNWPCWDASATIDGAGPDNDPLAPMTAQVTSTATSGAATTLTDTSQSWTTDEYNGLVVLLRSGATAEVRNITDTTTNTITVDTAWSSNPSASDTYQIVLGDSLHDDLTDAAIVNDCPYTPVENRPMVVPATMGWQGTLLGGGVQTEHGDIQRTKGTWLADDRGPRHKDKETNSWAGIDGFIRGITLGYVSSVPAGAGTAILSGEATGTLAGGWGRASGNQDVREDLDGSICVCNTTACDATVSGDNWSDSLVEGDIIMVQADSEPAGTSSAVAVPLRIRSDGPYSTGGTCTGTGEVQIPIGGSVAVADATSHTNIPIGIYLYDGALVIPIRSDYFDSTARVTNVTIAPNDPWNNSLGKCSETGEWTITNDDIAIDLDCDTNPLVGLYGGSPTFEDNVVREWHAFGVDGSSGAGITTVRGNRWFYGNGGPTMDYGYGWKLLRNEVWNSHFSGAVIASFGPAVSSEDLYIVNSIFPYIVSFEESNRYNKFLNTRVRSSAFGSLFQFETGTSDNTVQGVDVSGHVETGGTSRNGAVAYWTCQDDSNPCQRNLIDQVVYEGPGHASATGTSATNCLVMGRLNANYLGATENVFSNFRYEDQHDAVDIALFCNRQVTDTDAAQSDNAFEQFFERNFFHSNSIRCTGTSCGAKVYAGCDVPDGSSLGTNACQGDLDGSGGSPTGYDPTGCGNWENGVTPPIQACE